LPETLWQVDGKAEMMDSFRPLILFTLSLLAFNGHASAKKTTVDEQADNTAQTFELTTIAVVRDAPQGRIVDIWNPQTRFTSNVAEGDWVRVTGHFPEDEWQPSPRPLWIDRNYVHHFKPKKPAPKRSNRPDGIVRYIEVDKNNFELRVIEEKDADRAVIFKTVVALGMDRCLPKTKGGRCYYTEPGEYHVRWKIHDPKGIEWCIPKSMEKEYAAAIDRGERCYRGAIGNYALNIGKTYAIHGTSNPRSLGKRVSHGCVRTANNAIEKLYTLMDVGDKVYIVE
jgi:lipoprotein-anchoring transpeptidase ErfK/SrfK